MVLPIGFMCANQIELNIIKIWVYSSSPATPSPPPPPQSTYAYIQHTHATAETGFLFSSWTQLFHQKLFKFFVANSQLAINKSQNIEK